MQERINGRDFKEIWNSNEFTQLERENILLHSIQERMLDKNTFNGELFAGINSKLGKLELRVVDGLEAQITPQQKQQAQQLYSQYLEQNPNGSVEQFKNWIKGDKREYKSSSASLPLRGGKKVEYKNVSKFSEAINFLSQRFEIDVVLNKLNDDTQLNVFGSTGPLGSYDAVNNTVNINRDEEIYEGVVVHEFIHGFSRLMQTYNKKAFRSLVDYHYNSLSTDTETLRSLWKIAYDYGNLETIPKTLSELPEGQSKDYIYDEIFTRLIEREYNENGSLKDFEKPSSIFYKLFEWVKNFFGIKYNREKEFSKLTTSSTVKDFYNILKKVDNLKVSKEEYIKGTNTNESIYNVYKILNNRKFEDLNSQEKEEVNRYMKEYNDYMKSLPKLSISQKSQERLNQIQEIFNQNPELSKIGTVEQYSQYLDTIFPDSKVKDIVYKGGNGGISSEQYFSKQKEYAERYGNIKAYIVNLINPIYFDKGIHRNSIKNVLNDRGIIGKDYDGSTSDSIIEMMNGEEPFSNKGKYDVIVVNNIEQIHILGSKSDIEGFKEFVQGKQFQKLTAEEKSKTIEQVTKEHRSIVALKDLAHKLAHRIGGKVEFENRTDMDWKGYNQGMTSVLNEAYMDESTAFHEIMGHPIIRALKSMSSQKESVTLQQMINNQEIEKRCS